jgi:hypothetical protein
MHTCPMRNRVASALGGIGLFAALLGFVATALAPAGEADEAWEALLTFGLVAFLWAVFRGGD